MQTKIRPIICVTLTLLMVFTLVACGKTQESQPEQMVETPKGDGWLEKAELDQEDDIDRLYEEAKKEGKVVIYSMSSRITDVKQTFEEQYPGVTVEAYDMRMAEIFEKVEREHNAGINNADVIFIKDSDGIPYNEMVKSGMLHNYVPKDIGSKMKPEFKEPMFSTFFEMKQVFYNDEVYKTSPIDSWWDLTRPEYKGKIMIQNPLSTPENQGLFLAMIQNADEMAKAYKEEFGEDILLNGTENAGYEFIKRLMENDLIYTDSDGEIAEAIGAEGQTDPPFGIVVSSKIRDRFKKGFKIAAVQDIKPRDGVMAPAMLLIVDQAPHVNAAKLLIRWMAGEADGKGAGFKPFLVPGSWPTRSDIEPVDTPPIDSLNLWDFDLDFNYENINKLRDFLLTLQ